MTRALEPAEEAVAIAKAFTDRWEYAQGLRAYGEALRDLNHFEEARDALERALQIFADLGETEEEIDVRAALGTLYNQYWQPELAVPVLEPAVALLPAEETPRHTWGAVGVEHRV